MRRLFFTAILAAAVAIPAVGFAKGNDPKEFPGQGAEFTYILVRPFGVIPTIPIGATVKGVAEDILIGLGERFDCTVIRVQSWWQGKSHIRLS